jgi:hypothetical protein
LKKKELTLASISIDEHINLYFAKKSEYNIDQTRLGLKEWTKTTKIKNTTHALVIMLTNHHPNWLNEIRAPI